MCDSNVFLFQQTVFLQSCARPKIKSRLRSSVAMMTMTTMTMTPTMALMMTPSTFSTTMAPTFETTLDFNHVVIFSLIDIFF